MRTKTTLILIVLAALAPATRVNVKKLLSNGPHLPPITVPQNGGNLPPTCLPGGTCQGGS